MIDVNIETLNVRHELERGGRGTHVRQCSEHLAWSKATQRSGGRTQEMPNIFLADHWDFAGSGVSCKIYNKAGTDVVTGKFGSADFGIPIEAIVEVHLENVRLRDGTAAIGIEIKDATHWRVVTRVHEERESAKVLFAAVVEEDVDGDVF